MPTDIVSNSRRPRAIAKEKDGIVLYWVEELGIAGIHVRGIASLLQCGADLISDTIKRLEGVGQVVALQAETVTAGGIQGVLLVTESDLPKVLRSIERSKAKEAEQKNSGNSTHSHFLRTVAKTEGRPKEDFLTRAL